MVNRVFVADLKRECRGGGAVRLKTATAQNHFRQTCLKISLYFSFIKAGFWFWLWFFFFLHLCKCPDSVHLSFIFTVSLQDQGRFLLLHQEPGQEGRRCRGLGSSRLPPPSLLDPALLSSAAAQQVYPSPTPLNIFLDSPRRCPSLATLVSVSRVGNENRTVRDAVPVALDGVCQPLPRCG